MQTPLDNSNNPVEANFTNAAALKPKPVKWLWPGRIPLGHLTLIAGDPGVGKSTIATEIAARTSSNLPWPDHASKTEYHSPEHTILDGFPILPAQVIYLTAQEDLEATLLPRLKAAGAALNRVIAASTTPTFEDFLDQLEALLCHLEECRLVVVDRLAAYLRQFESSRGQEARNAVESLTDLAAKHQAAILGITQKTRSVRGHDVTRLTTSVALTAAARAIWTINPDPSDPRHWLFTPTKTNLAPNTDGLRFEIESAKSNSFVGQPIWSDATISLDEIDNLRTPRRSKHDPEIDQWLLAKLANTARPAGQLKRQALNDGFSWNTVRRSKARMSIESRLLVDDFDGLEKWYWQLPQNVTQPTTDRQSPNHHQPVGKPPRINRTPNTTHVAPSVSAHITGPLVEKVTRGKAHQ